MLSAWAQYLPEMLSGVKITMELTGLSLVVGVLFGFILAIARLSRVALVEFLATWYVEIIRAIPVVILLFIAYYSLAQLGFRLSGILAAVSVLGAFYATQYGEIFRGAIMGIDRGQTEAAAALGLSSGQTMRRIILPQAFFIILPPATNQLSNLIKDTSLVFTISVPDLMYQANAAMSVNFLPMDMLLLAGIIYFIFYLIIAKLLGRWETHVQRSRG